MSRRLTGASPQQTETSRCRWCSAPSQVSRVPCSRLGLSFPSLRQAAHSGYYSLRPRSHIGRQQTTALLGIKPPDFNTLADFYWETQESRLWRVKEKLELQSILSVCFYSLEKKRKKKKGERRLKKRGKRRKIKTETKERKKQVKWKERWRERKMKVYEWWKHKAMKR